MTRGITKVFVQCGLLPPKQTGPSNPMSDEESKQRKREQSYAAAKRRKELIKAARANGEPDPVFKMGRPRKPEEAKKKTARQTQRERIRQGLENLEARMCPREEVSTSL